jgi:TonB-dependent starch-binding outer membrane protein SusC
MKNNLLKTICMLSKYFLYGFTIQLMLFNFGFAINAKGQYESIEEVVVTLSGGELTLNQFFREVQRQTSFKFSYDNREVDRRVPLLFEKKTGTVEHFLKETSRQSKLSFRQINNNIDVVKKEDFEVSVAELATPITVSGKVTDENGEPVPGATVIVEGTNVGTVTDIEGSFTVNADEGAVLQISFIGYETQRITVGNQTTINS